MATKKPPKYTYSNEITLAVAVKLTGSLERLTRGIPASRSNKWRLHNERFVPPHVLIPILLERWQRGDPFPFPNTPISELCKGPLYPTKEELGAKTPEVVKVLEEVKAKLTPEELAALSRILRASARRRRLPPQEGQAS